MKTIRRILLIASFLMMASPARTTPVLFTMSSLTGAYGNRSILVVPDAYQNPLWIGTNLVPANPFTLQPVNSQVLTNLAPWGYNITVSGWPRAVHIVVTNDTATHNVTDFINPNNFSPLNIYLGSGGSSNGYTGIITNLASVPFSSTNYSCTITGNGGRFMITNGVNSILVYSNYVLTGSIFADGTLAWNSGSQHWVNGSTSLYINSSDWLIFNAGIGFPSCNSTLNFYLSPPETPQVWNSGGWTGTLPWTVSSVSNYPAHYNLESFVSGVCITNIFQ